MKGQDIEACIVCSSTVNSYVHNGLLKCKECGFIFLDKDSHFSAEDVSAQYDAGLEDSSAIARAKESLYVSALNRFERYRSANRILDMGCGQGHFLLGAKERKWHVNGIDISLKNVKYAREILGLNEVKMSTLKEERFKEGHFDVITLFNVIDYLDNPADDLTEAYRILRQGGCLFIRSPNAIFTITLLRLFDKMGRLGKGLASPLFYFNYNFSANTVRRFLNKIGFKPIHIGNSPLTKGGGVYNTELNLPSPGITIIKEFAKVLSDLIYHSSLRQIVLSPSFVALAEKS